MSDLAAFRDRYRPSVPHRPRGLEEDPEESVKSRIALTTLLCAFPILGMACSREIALTSEKYRCKRGGCDVSFSLELVDGFSRRVEINVTAFAPRPTGKGSTSTSADAVIPVGQYSETVELASGQNRDFKIHVATGDFKAKHVVVRANVK